MWRHDLAPLMTLAVALVSACETRVARHKASAASTAPQLAIDSAPSPPHVSGTARLNPSDLVGLRYGAGTRPPSDVATISGWIILPDGARLIEFRIMEAYYGATRVLLLERVYRRDASNSLVWEIVGVQQLPAVPPGYVLVRGTCTLGGRADGSIAAIARGGVERGDPFQVITHAWRADIDVHRFSDISLSGLRCLNKPFDGR